MFKILIVDHVHKSLTNGLKLLAVEVDYLPNQSLEETRECIQFYHAVVINTKTKMDAQMLEAAKNLEIIVRLGSGLDIIDLEKANRKGVKVFNTPQGNANAVGEHALTLLLCLFNNVSKSHNELHSFDWKREENRGIELDGKTIGIIGFGNTGPAFAKKLRGFDVEILVYDKYKQHFGKDYRYLKECTLEDVMKRSDVISLHIPLTVETEGWINEEFFNRCSKEVFLINTSRGKIVNTTDLKNAIISGKVRGACLDVLENEKPSSYTEIEKQMYGELFSFDNVIVTPHIAGWTFESKRKIAENTLELLERHIKDRG